MPEVEEVSEVVERTCVISLRVGVENYREFKISVGKMNVGDWGH